MQRQSQASPRLVLSRGVFGLMLLFVVFAIARCAGSPDEQAQAKLTTPTPEPPEALNTPLPPPPTLPPLDKIWQPPEPRKLAVLPTPTEIIESPDAMLVYKVNYSQGSLEDRVKFTQDGQVVVWSYEDTDATYNLPPMDRDMNTTYKLPPEDLAALKKQIQVANQFARSDRYWEDITPDVERNLVTITYKVGSRNKSVRMYGSVAPEPLNRLASMLSAFTETARIAGKPSGRPPHLVDYYLQGDLAYYTWRLDVDVDGGLN